jgi:hypothetical protein
MNTYNDETQTFIFFVFHCTNNHTLPSTTQLVSTPPLCRYHHMMTTTNSNCEWEREEREEKEEDSVDEMRGKIKIVYVWLWDTVSYTAVATCLQSGKAVLQVVYPFKVHFLPTAQSNARYARLSADESQTWVAVFLLVLLLCPPWQQQEMAVHTRSAPLLGAWDSKESRGRNRKGGRWGDNKNTWFWLA